MPILIGVLLWIPGFFFMQKCSADRDARFEKEQAELYRACSAKCSPHRPLYREKKGKCACDATRIYK
jgi:hypothetical protein